MRRDRPELPRDGSNHTSPSLSDSLQAEWKMAQEAIEPCKQSINRCVRNAINNPNETAEAALGMAAIGAGFMLTKKMPGAAFSYIPKLISTGAGIACGVSVGDALAPALDTWNHPENLFANASITGAKFGHIMSDITFSAITGGVGAGAAGRSDTLLLSNLVRSNPTLSFAEVPGFKGSSFAETNRFGDYIANIKYQPSDLPREVPLSGRVLRPNMTESKPSELGDIRLRTSEDDKGFKLATDVYAGKDRWVNANFWNKTMANLYSANRADVLLTNVEKMAGWLQSYKEKRVSPEWKDEWKCAQYKLSKSERLNSKQEMSAYVPSELPTRLKFSGECQFGAARPEATMAPGSVWFKRAAGQSGKTLIGTFEPQVEVGGQWLPCKLAPGSLKEELLTFSSLRESNDKAVFIRDAMNSSNISFERLIPDMPGTSVQKYLIKKNK